MQWLIDLVIEAIGIPPTFIDRGDPAAVDFTFGPLAGDAAWHDWDISGIVPAGASAVLLKVSVNAQVPTAGISLRTKGNANTKNTTTCLTAVAFLPMIYDCTVPLASDRIVEYLIVNEPWNLIEMTIKGWWL